MSQPVVDAGDGLPLTIPRLLHARADSLGDAVFVVCDDAKLSYRAAEQQSARLARALLAVGLGKGSRVGLLMPNGPDFVVAWLAAARIGAVAVPLSTFSKPAELAGMLRGADVEVLLATRAYRSHDYERTVSEAVAGLDLGSAAPVASPGVPTLRGVYIDAPSPAVDRCWSLEGLRALADRVDPDVLAALEDGVAPADPMVVVHTSGSTSEPKGVIHVHGALVRHLDNLNELRRYDREEVLFSNSPWFWIGGFAYALLGTLVAGARLVCSNAALASQVLDVLERERPTLVNGFAQSVEHLPRDPSFVGRDLSSIRRGNLHPIMPDDVRPKDPGLRHSMLGMTEAGSVCLASPDDETDLPEHQRGSFGRPVPGFEARILEAGSRRPCAAGETGELWLRSPFLMEGYCGRERSDVFDPDGWLCTGDLFHVDLDGLFYFHGRSGDMIKTAGANVSPREVEAALADAGVRAHIVGLDDAERGQRVAAAVVCDEPVDLEALKARLAGQLSSYKLPKVWLVLREDELPVMSSGKLDLRRLKELFDGR